MILIMIFWYLLIMIIVNSDYYDINYDIYIMIIILYGGFH